MKKILSLTLVFALLFSFASCSETPNETGKDGKTQAETASDEALTLTQETVTDATAETETVTETDSKAEGTVRIMAMTGPTGMGLSALIHNDKEGEGNRADYEVELVSAPDQVVPAIANKTCDIAAVPINLSSTLYARTKGQVQVLCANTLGVLYIVEKGDAIKSLSDLKGKTIYAPNPGSTPEYILRYVLKENDIDPDKDVTIEFFASGDGVAAQLAANPEAIGMLPEPKVSAFLSSSEGYRVALDMTEEWDKVAGEGNTLIQGVFVARTEFVKENPDLISAFLKDYDDSQKLVNTDGEKGPEYVVEAGIIPKAPLAKKAIPGSNITYLDGSEMKKAVSKCLEVLFEAAPQSVGGAMPGNDFYFAK